MLLIVFGLLGPDGLGQVVVCLVCRCVVCPVDVSSLTGGNTLRAAVNPGGAKDGAWYCGVDGYGVGCHPAVAGDGAE